MLKFSPIVSVIGVVLLSISAGNGSGSLCFIGILLIVVGLIGIYYMEKENQKKAELKEYNERKKVEEEKSKMLQKSNEFQSNNDLENTLFNIEFSNKYKISFLNFKRNFNSKSDDYIDLFHGRFYKINLNNKAYFMIISETDMETNDFVKVLLSEYWDEKIYDIYKNLILEDFDKYIYPYEYLKFIEYVDEIYSYKMANFRNKNSYAIDEELFGTAYAANKAISDQKEYTSDYSYLKFYFDDKFQFSESKYYLQGDEKKGSAHYTGLLKTVWLEKDINRINNSQSLMNNNESSANQIRELKSLLDDGLITQEEFEAKKKQLLNL